MADQIVPVVAVALDKERHFKASMGAYLRFQNKTGKNPLKPETMQAISESLKKRELNEDLFTFVWACLEWEDKTLTVEQVEDMIGFNNLEEVMNKLFEAIEAATPQEQGEKADKPPLEKTPPAG